MTGNHDYLLRVVTRDIEEFVSLASSQSWVEFPLLNLQSRFAVLNLPYARYR